MSRLKPVDISLLRNRLQYEFSELKCITEQELNECKWQVKKKVYSQLFSAAPSLQEHNEHLLDLLDERNKEVSATKSSKVIDRNIRLEEERDFRTKYLRLVLDGLQKLKWPPSQEAFSDPMDLLFNDPLAVIDSFKFLMDVAIPRSSSRFHDRDSTLLEQQLVESFDSFNSGSSVAKQKVSPKDSKKQSRVLPSSVNDPSLELSYSNISALNNSVDSSYSGGSRDYEYITTQPVDITNRSMASFDASVDDRKVPLTSRSTRSNMSTSSINSTSSVRSYYTVNGTRVTKSNAKYEFSMKSFEVLQTQNDLLRKKLKVLTDAIAARDQQESKMSAIMSELKMTIRDMVDISGAGGSRSDKRHPVDVIQSDLNKNPYLTAGKGSNAQGASEVHEKAIDEMAVFAEEVQREEQRRLAEKSKALGVRGVLPTDEPVTLCPHCGASSSSGDANKTKKADTSSVSVKSSGSSSSKAKPLGSFAKNHSANASVLSSATSGSAAAAPSTPQFKAPTPRQETAPASDSLSSSSALWSRLQSRLQVIEGQWSEAVRQTRSHAAAEGGVAYHSLSEQYLNKGSSPHHIHSSPSHVGGNSVEDEVLGLRAPSEGLVHQVMGIKSRSGGRTAQYDDSHGLDLNRIRQLQRDLVQFAESAAACVLTLPLTDDSEGGSTTRTQSRGEPVASGGGVNIGSAKSKQRLIELQDSAWLLLLHLSALAPIAPLDSESPYQSHITGLEAFTKEVFQLVGSKGNKNSYSKLQSLADRARAEQVAVIRALTAYRGLVKQWCDYGTTAAGRLDQLGAKYSHCINRTNNEIDKWASTLNELIGAFNEAEAARIVMEDFSSTGSSSARRVAQSPLNYLIKGSHGREIAALLSLLRDHRDDLYQIPLQLDTLSERLKSDLKVDLETVKRVEESYRQAVRRSESSISDSVGLDELSGAEGGVSSGDRANSSSRNRSAALRGDSSGSGSSKRNRQGGGGAVGYSTPKGKAQQQQPPAWNSSTVTSTVSGGAPPRPPFDTSYL